MWPQKIKLSKDGSICTNYEYTIKDYYIQPEPRIYTFLCLDSALPPIFVVRRDPRNWELETVDPQKCQSTGLEMRDISYKIFSCLALILV